jgi:hypothetical protein
MKEQSAEFILFLNPEDKSFYSYCPAKGILIKENNVPHAVAAQAQQQIEELAICLEHIRHQSLSSFQRRSIPLNLLTESKGHNIQENLNTQYITPNNICQHPLLKLLRFPNPGRF